jgi:RNA polymerase sigma-70 factor (ECF subfamily)
MPVSPMSKVLVQLRTVRRAEKDRLSDAQLLVGFLEARDDAAFEVLLRRHGPMVLGVCRRVLGNADDAEDAFQATFLVLVRKAHSITKRETMGGWLYGVAYKTALKARAAGELRRAKERRAGAMIRKGTRDEDGDRELRALLDLELSRLPDKYRVPIVLCDLEGKTRKDAAGLLGWPEGTLSGRLARARALLAKRLRRRGLALPGAAVTLGLSANSASACVSATLMSSTVRAASCLAGQASGAGSVSAKVAVLVEDVLKSMLLAKLKIVTAVGLMVGVLSGGLLAPPALSEPPTAAAKPESKTGEKEQSRLQPEKQPVRTDRYGDPLPPGALLRLGTVRLRAFPFRLAFLPGDKRLVSVGGEQENLGHVWDTNTGRVSRRLEMGNGYLAGSAFSPDGKTVALAYTDRKTATLLFLDTGTGKEIRRQDMPAHKVIGDLALTPDGQTPSWPPSWPFPRTAKRSPRRSGIAPSACGT